MTMNSGKPGPWGNRGNLGYVRALTDVKTFYLTKTEKAQGWPIHPGPLKGTDCDTGSNVADPYYDPYTAGTPFAFIQDTGDATRRSPRAITEYATNALFMADVNSFGGGTLMGVHRPEECTVDELQREYAYVERCFFRAALMTPVEIGRGQRFQFFVDQGRAGQLHPFAGNIVSQASSNSFQVADVSVMCGVVDVATIVLDLHKAPVFA